MRTQATECSVEEAAAPSDATAGVEGGSLPRRSAEADADKVRLQRLIRRKTALARRALAAQRRR